VIGVKMVATGARVVVCSRSKSDNSSSSISSSSRNSSCSSSDRRSIENSW
jgi:hypothetical protein